MYAYLIHLHNEVSLCTAQEFLTYLVEVREYDSVARKEMSLLYCCTGKTKFTQINLGIMPFLDDVAWHRPSSRIVGRRDDLLPQRHFRTIACDL